MHIETLRLFCDVVRLRSFSRGAEQNFVSQSAASQAVQQLETHLGVALIDRTKRPFVVKSAQSLDELRQTLKPDNKVSELIDSEGMQLRVAVQHEKNRAGWGARPRLDGP